MATGDLAADGGQLDESMIGVLVIVLVVLLSTGYVYLQQMQAPSAGPGGAANANNARAGGTQLLPGAGTRGGHTAHAPNAVSTVTLTRQQLRLHRSLPSRHGARTITICADALLQHKESDAIAWKNEDVSSVLGDLLQIADVYLLYVVAGGDDEKKNKEVIERIRGFIASSVVAFDDKTKRGLKIHKVLFCTTMTGKIAFVRQIEPQFHVEGAFSTLGVLDKSAVHELEKHVPRIVHVTASPQESAALVGPQNAHHVAESFTSYFKLLSALGSP